MTFRGREPGSRARTWDERDRRNMLLNVGFGVIVVASILLLAVAAGASWYSEHLAEAASVNGKTINRDQFRTRLAVDVFRNDYQERRLRTLLTSGQIRVSDYENRMAVIAQRKQQAAALALERLIDATIQAELAEREGVVVTDADIDARLLEEATIPELRHAWIIEVAPEVPDGAIEPGDEEKAAAKAKADRALADLRAGRDWLTVAREVSTSESRDQGGDVGIIDEFAAIDAAVSDALFAVAANTPTDVVEGADGTYRIGRVTEIVAPRVDATLEAEYTAEGISVADFREVIRADVVRTKLGEKITAPYLEPAPQRRVARIYFQSSTSESAEGAVKTRHILYSPGDDPAGADTLDEDDPKWAEAEAEARAAYDKLREDITQFDALARAESDEGAAVTTGGKLPYFSPADNIAEAFADAIFKDGLREGQLLEPVRSEFGWHVIQIMHFPTDLEWARKLRTDLVDRGADFAVLARDYSDGPEAAEGGNIGWVAKGILSKAIEDQIFQTTVGSVSAPLVVPNDGVYLFKVFEEQTREPDPTQRDQLERNVFPTWYQAQKATYEIRRDPAVTAGI